MQQPIPGFPGYTISDQGVITSVKCVLNFDCSSEYARVTLFRDRKRHRRSVHLLVAEVFLPNPENLPLVNHINGKKTDNRKENLEWCTSSHNALHALATGLAKTAVGAAYSRSTLTDEVVIEIRRLHASGNYSQPKLADLYQLTRSNINNIVHRYTWKHI